MRQPIVWSVQGLLHRITIYNTKMYFKMLLNNWHKLA